MDHSATVSWLLWILTHKQEPRQYLALPTSRMRVAPTRVRLLDVCVIERAGPREQVLTHPPLAVIEVLDEEDSFTAFIGKALLHESSEGHLLNKPFVPREQAIEIPPAAEASASTVTHPVAIRGSWGSIDWRTCQGSVETREQQTGIAKFMLDIDRRITTIWLWIDWVQHLRLCLIPPVGR